MIARDKSLVSYVEHYLLARTVAPTYAGHLRRRVAKLNVWAGRSLGIDDLSDELVSEFLAHLQASTDLAPSTIKGYRSDLIAVWNGAYWDRLIDTPPRRIRSIKVPKTPTDCFTHEEIQKLLAAASKLPGFIGKTKRSLWFVAWIRAAYDGGLRAADQLHLQKCDLRKDWSFCIAQGKTGVLHSGIFREKCQEAIKAMQWKGPTVWPWPWRYRRFFDETKAVVAAAGLKGTFKKIRRAAGTYRELAVPGTGHMAIGNGRGVFERHYEDRSVTRSAAASPPPLD